MNPLHCIIPVPVSLTEREGSFPLRQLRGFTLENGCPAFAEAALGRLARWLTLEWRPSAAGELRVGLDAALPGEGWAIEIAPSGVRVTGADAAGLRYALDALAQMLHAAAAEGPLAAVLPCGRIEDAPRFAWRGLLLDSARHFQRAETVKAVLRLMAHFRLNRLHWHLIDSQGFRLPLPSFPKARDIAGMSGGQYTASELREIGELASECGVEIVPELDCPGHSGGLLRMYPEYACDPAHPGEELCLGNPRTMEMLKTLYREAMALLPQGRWLHVGGDEASTASWEACPKCQAAIRAQGLAGARHLEHHFMAELKRFVREELGRQPISWTIPENTQGRFPLEFPTDDLMQSWNDLREPVFWAQRGHRVIYSLHYSLYLDYPRNYSETHLTWMFHVGDEQIYLCEPCGVWPELVKDSIIGTEACLWTETVPEWRVMPKLLPRLPAYAECCWSRPERKEWHDFARRKEMLEAAGYYEYLRQEASC